MVGPTRPMGCVFYNWYFDVGMHYQIRKRRYTRLERINQNDVSIFSIFCSADCCKVPEYLRLLHCPKKLLDSTGGNTQSFIITLNIKIWKFIFYLLIKGTENCAWCTSAATGKGKCCNWISLYSFEDYDAAYPLQAVTRNRMHKACLLRFFRANIKLWMPIIRLIRLVWQPKNLNSMFPQLRVALTE